MVESVFLSVLEGGVPSVAPAGAAPRMARAFERGAGFGLLDLVRFDVPSDAASVLHWLKDKARLVLVRSLRVRGGGFHACGSGCSGSGAVVGGDASLPWMRVCVCRKFAEVV